MEKKDAFKVIFDIVLDAGTHIAIGGIAGIALSSRTGLALKFGKVVVPFAASVYAGMLSAKGCKYVNQTIDDIDELCKKWKEAIDNLKEDSTEN